MLNLDQPPVERDFKENVRYILKRVALEVSVEGSLEKLAERMNVHPTTISHWMRQGDVPPFRARNLQAVFGLDLAPANKLSQEIADKEKQKQSL